MCRLFDTPFQHGEVFFLAGRGEIDHVGDVADEWDVEETEVRDVVHGRERAPEDE